VLWASVSLACGVAGTVGALSWAQPPVVGPWLWVTLMAIGVPLTVLLVAGATQALATGLIGAHMRRRARIPA
jgi:CP family cyanate transporter-like MFS transporter